MGLELLDLRRAAHAGGEATLSGVERWRELAARRLGGCDAGAPPGPPRPPPGTAVLAYAVLPERVVGWSLAGGRARRFDAGRPEALRAAMSRLRDELSRGSDAWRATAAGLRAALVGPAEADLRGAARVLVVADGFLRALPFAALAGPGGRGLGDEFSLAQGLAAASGLRGWDALRPLPPDPAALIVVGSGVLSSGALPGLPALAGAEAEGRALLAAYPRATLLAQSDARREAVLRAWPRADVVHVAAHGLEGPLDEGTLIVLGLGPDGGEVLRARDLRALRLPRAPVVVLGACHSASAERGDGALVAALLGAGARAVIATLWAVRDAESAAFLMRLHAELRAGHDAPEALRRARRASSPSAGAAFVAYVGPGACAR
jgi:CHAT domain-containing protein